jgi:outer membrane biosynthesis protein TonB
MISGEQTPHQSRIAGFMKALITLIVAAAAGVGGYFAEPSLRKTLVGQPKQPATESGSRISEDPAETAASIPRLETIPEPTPPPEQTPPPEPMPEPEIAVPTPELTPPAEVPTVPKPEPGPAFVPEPEPAPPQAQPATTPLDPVTLMQQHIQSGAIKEFTASQVTSWKPGPEETIDGTTFQTGIATYKAKTVFGVKSLEAKALIQDGKINRWIWSKSGMEIK